MEKIKRPKKINKQYNSIQTMQNYQETTNKQLNTIYDKIDEIIDNYEKDKEVTENYDILKNKPSINNVELIRNKTLKELGIQKEGDYDTNYITNAELEELLK